MAAAAVGTCWAAGSWSNTCWEEDTWGDAVVEINLFTEGVYVAVSLGDGLMYLKPAKAEVKANIVTGHVSSV